MHTVLNLSKNQEVSIDNEETIYEGFLKEGIDLPHGCLAGSCGVCFIKIEEGAKNLREPKTIEQDTVDTIKKARSLSEQDNYRLSCRARVKGKVSFSLPEK